MNRLLRLLVAGLVAALFICPGVVLAEEEKEKSVNEKLLEILIEKDIISKEQYEDLKKQAQKEEEAKKPKAVAGFNKGFYIESADKESRIKFDGRFHGDFKAYLGDHPDEASFFVRRARVCLSGTLYKYYDFRIEPEFGKGGSKLNDGFMNIHYLPEMQLKFGQYKTPFSLEELHSDNWIDFIERSLANKLAPSRDIGVMLHGSLMDDLFYYQLGLFNGYKYNEANDPDSGKDVAFRLVVAPFKESGLKAFQGLRLAGAVTYGQEELDEGEWWNSGDFKTAAGTTYLAMEDAVLHDGDRIREGAELWWDWGSTALKAEYIITEFNDLKMGNQTDDFDISGGYVSISHWLTGEKFRYKNGKPARVVPLENFQPGSPGWGAFQIGARWEFLKAEEDLLDQNYVDSTSYTDEASGFTVGLNWYPNDMVRFMLNYNHVEFDDPISVDNVTIDDEDVILTRFEVAL